MSWLDVHFRKEIHYMKRSLVLFSFFVLGVVIGASTLQVQAQFGPPSAERQAAIAKQLALEDATPKLQVTEEVLSLVVPGHTIGETEGVSKNSKGHLFVYSRTGTGGSSRGGTAAELFEFDENLKFVKLWGPDNYAASFAHSVRVDKYDNVWMVDEGSGMIVEFDPNANVKMTLGRKPEAIDYMERYLERGEKVTERYPVGVMGTFNRETDVAWDTQGNVYVGDRGNYRIQVYDTDLNFKKSIGGVGAPWSVQVTPKYIYSGDGTGKLYRLDHDGKLLGWAQTSLGHGQSGCLIHEIHAVSDNVIIKGDCSTWTVEKITIK